MWFPLDQNEGTSKEHYEKYFQKLLSPVPNRNADYFSDERGFRVKLVPFEEDVYGTWEDEKLCLSARTNSAGPGYHACLIDIIDEMGIVPIEVEDETGYYQNRDFALLQNEMAKWLKGLSDKILEMSASNDYSNLAISLSIDWYPEDAGHFTCCPLGYFEKDFFKRVQNGENVAFEFFVWWERPQNAVFFRNCAMYLIWCENNWLPPETDAERETIAATLECLKKAYTADPNMDYPAAEWAELARLLEHKGFETAYPDIARRAKYGSGACRGYNNGSIFQNVNGWRFVRSGKMHFDLEENGIHVWWDDNKTIRVTTISVRFEKKVLDKSKHLLCSVTENEKDCEQFSLRNSKIAACIQHTEIEENGEPLFQTRLFAALDDDLIIMSLYYVNAKDRKWAVDVCASAAR
jgi:hypothetical protein